MARKLVFATFMLGGEPCHAVGRLMSSKDPDCPIYIRTLDDKEYLIINIGNAGILVGENVLLYDFQELILNRLRPWVLLCRNLS